jgi:hypothetical protein
LRGRAHTPRVNPALVAHFATVGSSALAPRGRRGLWEAMAEATAEPLLAPLSGHEPHLLFLATLGCAVAADADAGVISLDAHRVRRLAR